MKHFVYELRNANGDTVYPYVGFYLTRSEADEAAREADGCGLRYGIHSVKVAKPGPRPERSLPTAADLRAAGYGRLSA